MSSMNAVSSLAVAWIAYAVKEKTGVSDALDIAFDTYTKYSNDGLDFNASNIYDCILEAVDIAVKRQNEPAGENPSSGSGE